MNLATRSLIAVVFSFSFLVSLSAEGNRANLTTADHPVQRQAHTPPIWAQACCGGPQYGKSFPYTSLVIEQDSTGGALEQRLRVEKNKAIYGCRRIPGRDVRCCNTRNANRLRLHRIHADAVFDTSQVELTGACYMEVDDGAGNPIPQVNPLFGGAELHGLSSFNWDFLNFTPALDGSEFRLDNTGFLEIPDGDDFLKTVSSRDVDALIVLQGQNISELLLEKGIPEARIPQVLERIERIVDGEQFGDLSWPYRSLVNINDDGVLNFVSSTYQQAVVFYEQIEAGESKESDSYDYADASYWFWLMCGDITEENIAPPTEVIIEDRIGADVGTTDGNGSYQINRSFGGGNGAHALIPLSINQDTTLTRYTGLYVYGNQQTNSWSQMDFFFQAWSSLAESIALPDSPLYEFFFEDPSSIEPTGYLAFGPPLSGPIQSYLLGFDLTGLGIQFEAGESPVVALSAINDVPGSAEARIVESTDVGVTDKYVTYPPVLVLDADTAPWSLYSGRYAATISGVIN